MRLPQAKLSSKSNQITRGRIRRFESDMPSHAVGSLWRDRQVVVAAFLRQGGMGSTQRATGAGTHRDDFSRGQWPRSIPAWCGRGRDRAPARSSRRPHHSQCIANSPAIGAARPDRSRSGTCRTWRSRPPPLRSRTAPARRGFLCADGSPPAEDGLTSDETQRSFFLIPVTSQQQTCRNFAALGKLDLVDNNIRGDRCAEF